MSTIDMDIDNVPEEGPPLVSPSAAVLAPFEPSQASPSIPHLSSGEGINAPQDGTSSRPTPARPPRKLNRSANQLHRNQACLPCRRRRIKCDAGRPFCSSCIRSYRFLARTQPNTERDAKDVQCFYEDSGEGNLAGGSNDLARGSSETRSTINKLEARVELQGALWMSTSQSSPSAQYGYAQTAPSEIGWLVSNSTWSDQSQAGYTPPSATTPGGQGFGPFPDVDSSLMPNVSPLSTELGMRVGVDPFVLNKGNLLETYDFIGDGGLTKGTARLSEALPLPTLGLDAIGTIHDGLESPLVTFSEDDPLCSNWPPHLPALPALKPIIDTFFETTASVSRLLNRKKLLSRLALSPMDSDFPQPALIHAICAITARDMISPPFIVVDEPNKNLKTDDKIIKGSSIVEDGDQGTFGDRQVKHALYHMRSMRVTGRGLLEIAQAKAIIAVYYQQQAKIMDGWMMTGSLVRLVLALGLWSDPMKPVNTSRSLLATPVDSGDREERGILAAYAMGLDVISSASAGLSSLVPFDEIASQLPATRADFDGEGSIPENFQTWSSSDLYTANPVTDNFIVHMKGIHLLGQVLKFRRRALPLEHKSSMRGNAMFNTLDHNISALCASVPPDMLLPSLFGPKGVDSDLFGAQLVPHIIAISLHDLAADMSNPHDASAIRMLAEARAFLSVLNGFMSTALDFASLLTPTISYADPPQSMTLQDGYIALTYSYCFVAAKTMIKFYKRALESQDLTFARSVLSEMEVFWTVFQSLSSLFLIGAVHSCEIHKLLKSNPDDIGDRNSTEIPSRSYHYRTESGNLPDTRPVRHGPLISDSVLGLSQPPSASNLVSQDAFLDAAATDPGNLGGDSRRPGFPRGRTHAPFQQQFVPQQPQTPLSDITSSFVSLPIIPQTSPLMQAPPHQQSRNPSGVQSYPAAQYQQRPSTTHLYTWPSLAVETQALGEPRSPTTRGRPRSQSFEQTDPSRGRQPSKPHRRSFK